MQTSNNSLILEILNVDHTCGSPLNWIIQNMKEVTFAGVNKPDFMQKIINSVIQCDSSIKAIDLVNKAIGPTIKIYEEFREKFEELYNGSSKQKSKSENIQEKKSIKK